MRHPLDPQLDPERKVIAEKQAFVESVRGTNSWTRWGEQYIYSCECSGLVVTSDWELAHVFATRHAACTP